MPLYGIKQKEELKMMTFIINTLSFVVGIIIVSVLSVTILFNKRFLKWYMKKVQEISVEIINDMTFEEPEESEDL